MFVLAWHSPTDNHVNSPMLLVQVLLIVLLFGIKSLGTFLGLQTVSLFGREQELFKHMILAHPGTQIEVLNKRLVMNICSWRDDMMSSHPSLHYANMRSRILDQERMLN